MERLTLSQNGPADLKIIKRAVEVLADGGVIAYPTDTIYGVGVDALDEEGLERLFALKKRDPKKPPLVLVSDFEMARDYVEFTPEAKRLADTFLPGPLTLVLKRNYDAPDRFLGGIPTVGIRIPKHSFCMTLSRMYGKPITSTSVNLSGTPPLTDPDRIEEEFGDTIDLLIDGGIVNNPPSTIVDFSGDTPKVLREGAITRRQLDI